jgi:polyhydroxyalkanoate synthesis repressor PhaR
MNSSFSLDLFSLPGNSSSMPKSEASPPTKLLHLRKYPNRRYYDTTRSRHVTLQEIHELIRQEYEIQVTDSKTGTDITAKVLGQILIDLDPPKFDVFPVSMLHRLLRSNEQFLAHVVGKYFNRPLTAVLDAQRSAEQYWRPTAGNSAPAPKAADWTKIMWGPFDPSVWRQDPTASAGQSDTSETVGQSGTADLSRAVEQLRRELAELKSQKSPRKKKKAR